MNLPNAQSTDRVWVDRLCLYPTSVINPKARRHGKAWCHLWCEPGNEENLHAIAKAIGLKRKYFQDKPGFPHYGLTPGKRKQALKAGATFRPLEDWVREKNVLTQGNDWTPNNEKHQSQTY